MNFSVISDSSKMESDNQDNKLIQHFVNSNRDNLYENGTTDLEVK